MKGGLQHVELYVRDLEKSKKFWSWVLEELNYKVYQIWDKGISFKLNETYLVFVEIEDRFRDLTYHRCAPGLNHLAFHGGSKAFVDKITRELKDRGITILYEDLHPYAGGNDYYAVYFEDPDRIKVEIVI